MHRCKVHVFWADKKNGKNNTKKNKMNLFPTNILSCMKGVKVKEKIYSAAEMPGDKILNLHPK